MDILSVRYDLDDLADDISTVLSHNRLREHPHVQQINRGSFPPVRLVNLFPEPLLTKQIIDEFFPELSKETLGDRLRGQPMPPSLGVYDLQTDHAALFSASSPRYIRSAATMMDKLRNFVGRWRQNCQTQARGRRCTWSLSSPATAHP